MFERLLVRLGILEEVEDLAMEDDVLRERKRRVLEPPPPDVAMIFCRGAACTERREALGEALRKGRIVLMDLRACERAVGQNVLDFVCSVAYADEGDVRRVAPGVFLALPNAALVEEWGAASPSRETAEQGQEGAKPGGEAKQ